MNQILAQSIQFNQNQVCKHRQKITYVCLHQDCKQPRGCCIDCISEQHYHHNKQVIRVNDLSEKSIQNKLQIQGLLKLIEEAYNSVQEIILLLENFQNNNILYQNFEQNIKQLIEINIFSMSIENFSNNMKTILQKGRECFIINQLSMNQNRQIIQEQDSYQSCQFQSILLNFLNLQQDELVEIKQEDKIISCPQYHAFFLIGESEIPKNQQSQIKIQLLKVGSIKFGLGDYKRFTEQNNWPDLQGNVHHGCYLIDEYGFVYEHGKENKIYNLKDNNQKWNFQMCENDQIVLKINQERQTMTWKNCHKPEYIELNFDQKNLKLHPLIFLSGSSIKIINQRE